MSDKWWILFENTFGHIGHYWTLLDTFRPFDLRGTMEIQKCQLETDQPTDWGRWLQKTLWWEQRQTFERSSFGKYTISCKCLNCLLPLFFLCEKSSHLRWGRKMRRGGNGSQVIYSRSISHIMRPSALCRDIYYKVDLTGSRITL